jgi:hypothetical protein
MATRLKRMFLVLLVVCLGSGVLGCDPYEPHYRRGWYGSPSYGSGGGWYGTPYYGSGGGRLWDTPWGTYGDERRWQHHHHDYDHDGD